ncbi:cobalt-precorrin-6A reductase [Gordonia insulae]|uniref:Precorrin-6A reductase n=1 Tax=Gordonia insulae TaxID=2420509 RepID=A0A3G8JHG0_9ACTN|nr:cobalt-precorrin-6A reductase [Gordonia insulae]AZG44433.1 Precorrin-6A reductase [Gordonia insulae]
MGDRPILLLGGTGEARALAAELTTARLPVVSSLAGRVRDPRLPMGEVRIGGFGGIDGLVDWLRAHDVMAVVDATHPFAATISEHAAAAAATVDLPLLRLRRPSWTPGPADTWESVPDMTAAAQAVAAHAAARGDLRVLLTTGRQDVGVFAPIEAAWFLIRVVDPPTAELPPRHRILRSRGPYDVEGERTLLQQNGIGLLVTKNSGGELTRAKLVAAAELGVGVIMVQRPPEPGHGDSVESVSAAIEWIRHGVTPSES